MFQFKLGGKEVYLKNPDVVLKTVKPRSVDLSYARLSRAEFKKKKLKITQSWTKKNMSTETTAPAAPDSYKCKFTHS